MAVPSIDWLVRTVERFVADAAGTGTRVAVTLGLLIAAAATILVLTPYLTRTGTGILARWLRRRDTLDPVQTTIETAPTGLLVRGIVRTLQATELFVTALAILIVWGQLGLATSLGVAVATAAPVGVQIVATVLLGLLAYVGTGLLEEWLADRAADADYLNQHQEGIVFRVLQLSIIVATILGMLFIWQVNPTGLLVGAGFLGIVVGMAARQTLGSVIAGFVLMFSRPMELGDWVEIDDREGIVTDITIVNTRLRNFDGETVVIPNDRVSNATVINRSEQGQLRVRVDVGIDYDADIETARQVARAAIDAVDEVAGNPTPQVVPTGFGDSGVTLQLRFWIARPTIAWEVKARSAVVREVKAAFDRADIKIPYPQRELSGRAETGGFEITRGDAADVIRDPTDD